jgi:hypothetical protein
VVLGTVGLGMTIWLTLGTVYIFGVFLVIGGGVQIFQTFKIALAAKGVGRQNAPAA